MKKTFLYIMTMLVLINFVFAVDLKNFENQSFSQSQLDNVDVSLLNYNAVISDIVIMDGRFVFRVDYFFPQKEEGVYVVKRVSEFLFDYPIKRYKECRVLKSKAFCVDMININLRSSWGIYRESVLDKDFENLKSKDVENEVGVFDVSIV